MISDCLIMTITFDDLPHIAESSPFPELYMGLKWSQFRYTNKLHALEKHPKSGYVISNVIPISPYIVWSSREAEISSVRLGETFSMISLTAYAAWSDDLQLNITGYRKSCEMNSCSITLTFGKPQRIVFGWKNLDQVIFEPCGGNPRSDSGRSASSLHFVISQLTIC